MEPARRGQGLRRRLLHIDNLGLLRIRPLLLIVHRLLLGVFLRILLLVVMIHGAADRGRRPADDCRSHRRCGRSLFVAFVAQCPPSSGCESMPGEAGHPGCLSGRDAVLRYNSDWRPILYAILSLTVVRMAPVALALRGTGLRRDTVSLMGWFGPRGLASVVFTLMALKSFQEVSRPADTLIAAATWTILLSVVAHGLSADAAVGLVCAAVGGGQGAAGRAGRHVRAPLSAAALLAGPPRR